MNRINMWNIPNIWKLKNKFVFPMVQRESHRELRILFELKNQKILKTQHVKIYKTYPSMRRFFN